jgi:hypothetical protein
MKNTLPRLLTLSSAIGAACLVSASQANAADLLTYWNFNNTSPAFNGSLGSFSTTAASYGEKYTQTANSVPGTLSSNTANGAVYTGSIDFSSVATITNATINGKTASAYTLQNSTSGNAGYGAFSEATGNLNRVAGDTTTGGSLLFLNPGGNANNKAVTFTLSSLGYETLSLSYATRFANGFAGTETWTYSLNGTDYFALGSALSVAGNATWSTKTLDLSSLSSLALDNQATFFLRVVANVPTNGGSYSFDNIQLTGITAAVPEPSTYALLGGLGVLGIAGIRRRRG